jgi:hypothetical protein
MFISQFMHLDLALEYLSSKKPGPASAGASPDAACFLCPNGALVSIRNGALVWLQLKAKAPSGRADASRWLLRLRTRNRARTCHRRFRVRVRWLVKIFDFENSRAALTRTSHQLSTAAAYPGLSASLLFLGLLDVLSSTPAGPSVARVASMPFCAASLLNPGRDAG